MKSKHLLLPVYLRCSYQERLRYKLICSWEHVLLILMVEEFISSHPKAFLADGAGKPWVGLERWAPRLSALTPWHPFVPEPGFCSKTQFRPGNPVSTKHPNQSIKTLEMASLAALIINLPEKQQDDRHFSLGELTRQLSGLTGKVPTIHAN